MPPTVANRAPSTEVQTLDSIRRVPAKAEWQSPTESTTVDSRLSDRLASIVESALTHVHGSQKAAAIEIGVDQSQLKRQIRIGTFDVRQMSAAGEAFLAALGEELIDAFGSSRKSKKQIAREQIPQLLALMMSALDEDER